MNLNDVEKSILDQCIGRDILVYSVMELDEGNKKGLVFDLFDYLDKQGSFEESIKTLLYVLDKTLDEKFIFSHNYSDESSVCGLDGEEYPDYHCVLKVWELIE